MVSLLRSALLGLSKRSRPSPAKRWELKMSSLTHNSTRKCGGPELRESHSGFVSAFPANGMMRRVQNINFTPMFRQWMSRTLRDFKLPWSRTRNYYYFRFFWWTVIQWLDWLFFRNGDMKNSLQQRISPLTMVDLGKGFSTSQLSTFYSFFFSFFPSCIFVPPLCFHFALCFHFRNSNGVRKILSWGFLFGGYRHGAPWIQLDCNIIYAHSSWDIMNVLCMQLIG